ncbi:unnamed protein product [Orchesella dallaii]|uniref:RING-type domain-containing protein n=1 Tax=Orchesella dallaii TaxID=48710 RepID=A0ABP1QQ01_9HEXA
MFICKLCKEGLLSNHDIIGTFCGHMFHPKCLDKYLLEVSSFCPSCHTSLCVDSNSEESDYCLLPLYPESNDVPYEYKISEKNTILQENVLLKRKLLEVIHALVLHQRERKDRRHIDLPLSPHNQNNCENVQDGYTENNLTFTEPQSPTSTIGKQRKLHKPEKHKVSVNETNNNITEDSVDSLDILDPDLLALCTQPSSTSLSEEDESRILRSKRREYLTWRNKAQSWLSKMEVAFNKLLGAEQLFSPKEFLQELRKFFNKTYNQGEIVDTAKQAGVVYLIIADVPQSETDEIHETIIRLARAYSAILTNVMDALNSLENKYGTSTGGSMRHSEKDSTSLSNYNSIDSSDRCSSISDDEVFEDIQYYEKSSQEVVDDHVSLRPIFSSKIVVHPDKDNDIFREPIFV